MMLSDSDLSKIERFVQRFDNPAKLHSRVIQIIEMSSDGLGPKDIQKEVRGAFETITETRMWSRREGLW